MSSISTDSFFKNVPRNGVAKTGLAAKDSGTDAVVEEFLKEAKKSPIERLREAYLKAHNMSEADLAALPPAERQSIEDDIRKSIQEAMKKQPKQGPKSFADILQEAG
jgi:hypothetical protein